MWYKYVLRLINVIVNWWTVSPFAQCLIFIDMILNVIDVCSAKLWMYIYANRQISLVLQSITYTFSSSLKSLIHVHTHTHTHTPQEWNIYKIKQLLLCNALLEALNFTDVSRSLEYAVDVSVCFYLHGVCIVSWMYTYSCIVAVAEQLSSSYLHWWLNWCI